MPSHFFCCLLLFFEKNKQLRKEGESALPSKAAGAIRGEKREGQSQVT